MDYTIEHPGRESRNGFHLIPVVELSLRVLAYYWKPTLKEIRQRPGGGGRIPKVVESLAKDVVSIPGIVFAEEDAGGELVTWVKEAHLLPMEVVDALLEVRSTVLEQPLQYIHEGPQQTIFSLVTDPVTGEKSLSLTANYHEHRIAAPKKREVRATSWLGLLENERTSILLSSRAFEEITAFRYWLRDAILMRWVAECERYNNQEVVPLSAFRLTPPKRDRALVEELKTVYTNVGATTCFYSGKPLGKAWDLDHVLPYSRFPVNYFWNLVPASVDANRGAGGKFDRLHPLTPRFRARYLDLCEALIESMPPPITNHLHSTYRSHFQVDAVPSDKAPGDHAIQLWSLLERSWKRLEDAGVAVWVPTSPT